MISIKSPEEMRLMAEGGKKIWRVLQNLLDESVAGVSLLTLEDHAEKAIASEGGTPSFQTVQGYRWATCLCVNDQVVHGIPSSYILEEGDVLTIDIGMVYKGFHTDTAWTKIIDRRPSHANRQKENTTPQEEKERFLKAGEIALKKAIRAAVVGNRVGHISNAIEDTIRSHGFDVIRSLTGHGVGKYLHEEPLIPEYLDKPIEKTSLLTSGMTLAIEVIYAMGKGSIVYANDDGWTLSSKDHSLTAVFEQSVALFDQKTAVLTGP